MDVFAGHASPQAWKPVKQTKPQSRPSHEAAAFDGGAHGVHDVPQESTHRSPTHSSPHAWYVGMQLKLQAPCRQTAAEYRGGAHTTQASPHADTSESSTHWSPHAWRLLTHAQVCVTESQAPGWGH